MTGLLGGKNFDNIFSSVDNIPECCRWTERTAISTLCSVCGTVIKENHVVQVMPL